MYKKIRLAAPGDLRLETIEKGMDLQNGMVKVEVKACAICGSDLALLSEKRDMTKELYFGHEFSGIVTEISKGSSGVKVGDRVASELARTCGQCWHCLNGLENYCRSMKDGAITRCDSTFLGGNLQFFQKNCYGIGVYDML